MAEVGRVRSEEVREGTLVKIHHPPFHVVVARVGDGVFAIEDACPHSGRALSSGSIDGHRITCPAHGWVIDVRDGTVETEAGTGDSNPTYRVAVDGDWVVVHDD